MNRVGRSAALPPGTSSPRMTRLFLVLLLGLICLVRFWHLGDMDTRADEVWTLQYLQAGNDSWDMAAFCWQDFKTGRQMPLSRLANSVLNDLLGTKPTLFTVRFPYAVMGVLCIPAFWLVGAGMGSRRLAWVLAWLTAINPYLLHWSKVAHNYSFAMCLFTFAVAGFVWAVREVGEGGLPRRRTLAGFCVASILGCYTHMSVWPAAVLLWLLLAGFLWRRKERRRTAWVRVGVGFGLLLLSLLPWTLVFISAVFTAKETFIPSNADNMTQLRRMMIIPHTMTWGGGWRSVITLGLPAVAIAAGFVRRAEWRRMAVLLGTTGVVFLLLFAMQYYAAGNFDAVRYYTPVWTGLMLLSGLGVMEVARVLARVSHSGRAGETGSAVLTSILLGAAMIHPAYWTITLPATSIPYTDINRWMDRNLPAGAPVLVDRWFEPWNEMRTHAPSNVVVTFTIPNEPADVFKKYQWRETAKQFLVKYPDAAYLEIVKQYFFDPEVGWWDWPRQYFRRHVVFTNEQALALARINMMPNPIATFPGSDTNRIITELFYNTPSDVADIAVQDGRRWVVFYASGWGYAKLWPQVQDFRDWRVIGGDYAVCAVWSTMGEPRKVRLRIRGVALGGSKSLCVAGGPLLAFPEGRVMELDSQPLDLVAGHNEYDFRVSGPSAGRDALLVEDVEVQDSIQPAS